MRGVDALLALAALPALLACGYLFLLTVLSRRVRPPAGSSRVRFAIVVPAHDEEEGIGGTVRSLLAIDYPRALFEVVVIADNCSDATADRAAQAGATVLIRRDPERRGKGYALQYAFAHTASSTADAVVVVDADTVASPDLLKAFAARLEEGALAIQADYAVRNPDASWRTRLMAIALGSFHELRSRARERLGVSCGLRGNGMCFATSLLRRIEHNAFSVVEDLEFGVLLGREGVRVHYAAEAHVYGEMVTSAKRAVSQRRRWEGGRKSIARRDALDLLRTGALRRDPLLIDLAADLLVPPLSQLAIACCAGVLLSAWLCTKGAPGCALLAWSACLASIAAYVARGWALSRTGARGLVALAGAPFFAAWKLGALLARPLADPPEWVRTAREPPAN
jgi:1,2-diacylglycerol 3-beta-glucosyltransferase